MDFIRLGVKTMPVDYTYQTELVSIGSVTKSISFNSLFEFTADTAEEPFLAKIYSKTDKNYDYFNKGDIGLIQFIFKNDIYSTDKKTIELKAIVSDVVKIDENRQKVIAKIDEDYIRANISYGVRAVFQIATEKKENKLRIPVTSIKYYGDTVVAAVLKDDVRSDRIIKTGFTGDEYVEVISGLSEGEIVVTGSSSNN